MEDFYSLVGSTSYPENCQFMPTRTAPHRNASIGKVTHNMEAAERNYAVPFHSDNDSAVSTATLQRVDYANPPVTM